MKLIANFMKAKATVKKLRFFKGCFLDVIDTTVSGEALATTLLCASVGLQCAGSSIYPTGWIDRDVDGDDSGLLIQRQAVTYDLMQIIAKMDDEAFDKFYGPRSNNNIQKLKTEYLTHLQVNYGGGDFMMNIRDVVLQGIYSKRNNHAGNGTRVFLITDIRKYQNDLRLNMFRIGDEIPRDFDLDDIKVSTKDIGLLSSDDNDLFFVFHDGAWIPAMGKHFSSSKHIGPIVPGGCHEPNSMLTWFPNDGDATMKDIIKSIGKEADEMKREWEAKTDSEGDDYDEQFKTAAFILANTNTGSKVTGAGMAILEDTTDTSNSNSDDDSDDDLDDDSDGNSKLPNKSAFKQKQYVPAEKRPRTSVDGKLFN